jgi:hypothetical protein
MKKILNILLNGLLCMSAVGWFCGCTEDSEPAPQNTHEVHISLSPRQYEDVTPLATRTTLPTDYVMYDYATALTPIAQIQGYMTSTEDKSGEIESKYVPCLFNYEKSGANHTWVSTIPLKDGQYYFYGFMPKEDVGSSVTIAPYDDTTDENPADYAKGAVLTLTGLNAVTPDDICIVVGAQGYGSAVGNKSFPESMTLGKFAYHTNDGDNLFLLIDHLYAGMEFQMSLGTQYAELRKIEVTSVKLTPVPAPGSTTIVKTVKATVTIVANQDGSNPISSAKDASNHYVGGHVEFETESGTDPVPAELHIKDNMYLTTTSTKFLACMAPSTNTNYQLETTYNVYDKKDNLIRENQKAVNKITVGDLKSGQIHTVKLKVEPTYLYVMSEDDLDDPGEKFVVIDD